MDVDMGGVDGAGAGGVGKQPRRVYKEHIISGHRFFVEDCYTDLKPIGGGSYGLVCSAVDKRTGEPVAIKKVAELFKDLIDAKRILREIKLLRKFGGHENITSLLDISVDPPMSPNFKDMYIVTELFECDLDRIVSSSQALSNGHAQYFLYQALRALKYIHSANVLHRDLKPCNILVNGNCDLAICDFGLARVADDESLTQYVVTRWYRAPELLMESKVYGPSADVWSVGCIFAEILIRKALLPGKDYLNQLQLIMDCVGTPTESDLGFCDNRTAFRKILSFAKRPCRLAEVIRHAARQKGQPIPSEAALDLLDKMMKFDPAKRISVEDALAHEYLRELHDERDEPCAQFRLNEDPDFAFEKRYPKEMPRNILVKDMVTEMMYHHQEEVGVWSKLLQGWRFGADRAAEAARMRQEMSGGGGGGKGGGELGGRHDEEKEGDKGAAQNFHKK